MADASAPLRRIRAGRAPRLGVADRILRLSVWLLGLGPVAWVARGLATDELGANPVEAVLHLAGDWALVFLLLSLGVTPLRRLTGWGPLIKVRRLLGLLAFFYALSHFLVYLVLDQGLAWSFVLEDVTERPFITVGFASLLLLTPLALTSTRGWVRRLGKRWQTLHRLVYPAAGLAVVHFYWKVKADTFWPLLAGGILLALLLARLPWRRWAGEEGEGKPRPGRGQKGSRVP